MAETQQQTSKPSFKVRFSAYLINHLQVLLSSLGRIWRAPFASLMTVSVIAIALALPTGFYILLKNAQQLSGGWDGAARISLYLSKDTSETEASALAKRLQLLKNVEKLRLVSREQALEEFKALSGFDAALDALDENPLPTVIVITPSIDPENPQTVEALLDAAKQEPAVESAQLDLQWVKRLYTIMHLVQRGLLIIAAMLGIAVILVIGNTIRLDIQSRRTEIEVNKLIGATNAFIRRPFLYTGFWYGLLGGILAWFLVTSGFGLLRGPAQQLAGLYDSNFALLSMTISSSLVLLALAVSLGYLGSWLAVGRHLRDIEPG